MEEGDVYVDESLGHHPNLKNAKRRQVPSSASSVHPSNQPSKGIILDQQLDPLEDSYAGKAAELGFDEMMASRTNFNKADISAQ